VSPSRNITTRRTTKSRRAKTRRFALVAFATLAAGLVGIPSALGSAWLPWSPATTSVGTATVAEAKPLTTVPPDQPEKGMVHRGLKPAKKGSACVGEYEVVDTGRCSHGPDEVPAGLNVRTPVAPVAPAKPEPKLPATGAAAGPGESVVSSIASPVTSCVAVGGPLG
jgi:hypothetical protein